MDAMLRSVRFRILAVSALALMACSVPLHVNSFAERGVDFAQYRTYNWAPHGSAATGDPRLDNNPFFEERVRADVETQLGARGFERTAAGTPDLLVHYHATITQKLELNGADEPYSSCANCAPFVYDAGTLLLDFVDARTNTLVWRGWSEGSMEGVIDDQTSMEEHIDRAVTRILEKLPHRM